MPEEKATAGGECRGWLLSTPNSEIWTDSGEGRNRCPSRGLAQCATADLPGLSGQQQGVRKWGRCWSGGATSPLNQCPPIPPPPAPIGARSAALCCQRHQPPLPSHLCGSRGRCPITVLCDLLIKMTQPLIPDQGVGVPRSQAQ